MYIVHSCPLSHNHEQILLKTHIQIHNTFEPNVFKLVIKTNFINSIPFAFLIINVKIPLQFSEGMVHIWLKKRKFE